MFDQIKRVLKHSFIYALGSVTSGLLGFLLLPVYTRYLTTADYGVLAICFATLYILTLFFSLGTASGLSRSYLYEYDDPKLKKTVLSTALIFVSFLAFFVVVIISVAFANRFSQVLFGTLEYRSFIYLILFTAFFQIVNSVLYNILRVKEASKRFVIFSLIEFLLRLGLNIYFVVGLNMGVKGILLGTFIGGSITSLLLILTIIKELEPAFSFRILGGLLRFGAPLAVSGLGMWVLNLADRFFLQHLYSLHEVGIYSVGYKVGMIIMVVLITPFIMAWPVVFFDIAKQEKGKQTIARVLTYFMFITVLGTLALSVFSQEILRVMVAPAFFDAYKVIPLVAGAYILLGIIQIMGAGIALKGKSEYHLVGVIVAALINLALNLVLIPPYGMMGAAVATLISFFVMVLLIYYFSQRYYPVTYEVVRIFKIVLTGVIIYLLCSYINADLSIGSLLMKLIILLFYPGILYLLRFFSEDEIGQINRWIKRFLSRKGFSA